MRFVRSLTGRLTAAMALVALVVGLVSAVAAWQLVRAVAEDQARAELVRQATTLAASPRLRQQVERRERVLVGAGSTRTAIVDAAGRVRGEADVPAGVLADVRDGRDVSTTVDDGGSVLVEARATRNGGAVVLTLPLAGVDDAGNALLLRLLAALAVGLGVAAGVGALLARHLARPLVRTATTARRLADGERGLDVGPTGLPELDDVGAALVALDDALARSERRQREFLLSVSHEMRTPLTAIQGYADALADGLLDGADVRGTGRTLGVETRRLDRFVWDLLLLARLEADDFTLESEPVDVGALLHAAGRAWDGEARRCGVVVRVEVAGEVVTTSDAMRLRQLVDGLVENALRATPAGGTVVVAARRTDTSVWVSVADDGPGLSDDDLAVALDRGALHQRHRGRRPVGTGLGLSIAARLARRLGGRLRPEPSQSGARFVLELPVRAELSVRGDAPASRGTDSS